MNKVSRSIDWIDHESWDRGKLVPGLICFFAHEAGKNEWKYPRSRAVYRGTCLKPGYFCLTTSVIIFSTAWSVSVTRSAEFFLLPDMLVLGLAVVIMSPAFLATWMRKSWTS